MTKLLTILFLSLVLAFLSEKNAVTFRLHSGKHFDLALIVLVIVLSTFCGLRTDYNDTRTYINGFLSSPTLIELLEDPPNLLGNPGYYWFQSIFRHHISDNYHVFLLLIAFFTVSSMVLFVRRYSNSFTFSILVFFSLGLYISNFAAMKQSIAIAILTFSVPKLLKHNYLQFYILVFIAMLFHTYALMFAIAPLFLYKPWTPATYLCIAGVVLILFAFDSFIGQFLELADSMGKEISEEIVLDTEGINLFRLAVFSVPFLISFLFRNRIKCQVTPIDSLMINMSSFSFLIMSLGIYSGANLFGRSANYFSIGVLVALPWMIKKIFNIRSSYLVLSVASLCYLMFFWYGNSDFDSIYRGITLGNFLVSLF